MSSLTKLLLFIGICTGCTLGKTSSEEPVDCGHKKNNCCLCYLME